MAIQFDSLPVTNPYSIPEAGIYKAKIVEAEMRTPKTKKDDGTNKPDYLNLKYELTKHDGSKGGTMYDMMAESTSSVVQFKLARFLLACGIPLVGAMELSDIAKLVMGKEIVVDVMHDTSGSQPRAQVDPFTHEAYYPVGQFDEIYNVVHAENGEDADVPAVDTFINPPATDAEEAEY